jgi:Type IV secretion-system coupling protein DNA-binding domain
MKKFTIITVFWLFLSAILATTTFPFIAGLYQFENASVFLWVSYWLQGHYFLFWQYLAVYLGSATSFYSVVLGQVLFVTTIVSALVSSAIIIAFLLNANQRENIKITTKHKRGSQLISYDKMPKFVANLIVKEIYAQKGWSWFTLKNWFNFRYLTSPTATLIKKIRLDAKSLNWTLARKDAKSIAHTLTVSDDVTGLVRVAGLPIPLKDESYHLLICGSTGQGKSVALRQLLADIRSRSDRVILVDAAYDLSQDFKSKNDIILCADDPHSQGWDLRNEIRETSDWARYAQSVIPAKGGGDSAEWAQKAQSFFTAICKQIGTETTNAKLLEIVTTWSTEQLATLLEGSPASSLLAEGGDRYLVSVRNNISEKLAAWEYSKSGDFSLRDYIQSNDRRWLWLPYHDTKKGVQAPAIAAWLDMLVLAALGDKKIRTWIIIDELDSIGTISGLKEAVTRLRKSNVSIVAAIQDYSQLKETYGENTAKTLISSFTNKLFLRCNGSDLADIVSKELGEEEIEETHTKTSKSSGVSSSGKSSGKSVAVNIETKQRRIQTATQIQGLPTRTGFVMLNSYGGKILPVYLPV